MFPCHFRVPLAVGSLLFVALLPRALSAAEAEGALTLTAAVEQTLAHNPDLRTFNFRFQVQEARGQTASLPPPLEFRGELENVLGTGRTRGFDAAEATFALSRVIELGQKRQRRIEAAGAGGSLLEVQQAAAQLDVVAEVTRRFIHVASDQEQLRYTAQATGLARQTVTAAEARLAAARAPEVEVRRARISLARALVEQEHAEHELLTSRHKLAALWGDTTAQFGPVQTDLYQLPEVDAFDLLLARLDRNPDFLTFASTARLRDAEIRVAEAKSRGDIALTAGVRRLQETEDEAFVLGITIPLSTRSRSQGAIAEATALRNQTTAELEAHRIRVQAQLFELYQELRHAITEAQMLRTEVMPEMEAVLEDTRYAFERGRYSYLEWVDAQHELVSVQRALVTAATNAHLYVTEIERLTAEPLSLAE